MNAFALFGVSILASFVSSLVAARSFAWPRLENTDRDPGSLWRLRRRHPGDCGHDRTREPHIVGHPGRMAFQHMGYR